MNQETANYVRTVADRGVAEAQRELVDVTRGQTNHVLIQSQRPLLNRAAFYRGGKLYQKNLYLLADAAPVDA
jgi:hypothetical protein